MRKNCTLDTMKKLVVLFLFFMASACFAQTEADSVPYTIDLAHSKFKFESRDTPDFFRYTIGGQQALYDSTANYFTVVDRRNYKEHGFEVRKQIAKELFDLYKGLKQISELSQKEIVIAGEKAFEIYFTTTYTYKTFKQYVVILGDNKATLFFVGKAMVDFDKTIKEFKAIARSIKIK